MLRKSVPCLMILLIFTCAAYPQMPVKQPPANAQRTQRPRLGQLEEEMFRRAEIRHAEESHRELVERAKEAAELSVELRNAFERSKTLNRDDYKKLERIEKLARKIRSGFGGSDDDQPLEGAPDGLGDAVKRLSDLAEEMNEEVGKTTRHVVSGAVIESSNQLIELVRLIRAVYRK